MSIAKVGTTVPTVAGVASTSVTPAWAGDMPRTAGHLLVARVAPAGTSGSLSGAITSTGSWAQAGVVTDATTTYRAAIWYLIAAGSDAAPTFSQTGAALMFADLEEFSGNSATPLQANSVGTALATSGTTLTVTMANAPAATEGLGVTAGVYNGTVNSAHTPGTSWVNGGWSASGAATNAGGDYYLNPASGTGNSELVTWANTIAVAGLVIACFAAGAAASKPGFFASVGKPGPRVPSNTFKQGGY